MIQSVRLRIASAKKRHRRMLPRETEGKPLADRQRLLSADRVGECEQRVHERDAAAFGSSAIHDIRRWPAVGDHGMDAGPSEYCIETLRSIGLNIGLVLPDHCS